MAVLDGLLGRYEGIPDNDVPAPPEWLAAYLYTLFQAKLHGFFAQLGIDGYRVTSGFRDPHKNEAVGGARNSAHMHGLAADVVFSPPLSHERRANLVNEWKRSYGFAQDEGDHVHFNLPRAWGWRVIRWLALAVSLGVVLLGAVIYFEAVKRG